jgi:hypothetical protein
MNKKPIKREISDKTILDRFAKDFAKIIEKHCKYIIVSGFIAISHGRSRGTEDIDIIIEKISNERFCILHGDLIKNGFECIQSDNPHLIYTQYLLNKTSIRYIRKKEFLPEMKLKMARDPLDDYQIKTRVKLPLTKLDLWFSSIEMNIAFKEEALKSDKDLEDAKHLRIIYEEKIDEKEIEKIKKMIRQFRK